MTSRGPLERVLGAIVQPVVDAVDVDDVVSQVDIDGVVAGVDIDGVIQRVDIDGVIQRVDIDGVIQRVDIGALLDRVDLDTLLDKIDLNALLTEVDLNTLLANVDLDALLTKVDLNTLLANVDLDLLLAKVDLNTLMAKVDLDALLADVDVEALVHRANIDAIVRNASRGIFATTIDLVRRQLVGLDTILNRVVSRILRRDRDEPAAPVSGTVTGGYGGAVSRLAAFAIDTLTLNLSYGLLAAFTVFLAQAILGRSVEVPDLGPAVISSYAVLGFLYYWIGYSVTGRSIGKAVVGLRVVASDGSPITPGRAAIRMLVYPFSFILGLGLIPIVTARRHRALHDAAGRDLVLYDWGDRPAEMPAPLTAFLRRQDGVDLEMPEAPTAPPRSAA